MKSVASLLAIVLLGVAVASAQTESDLKRYFEGKQVILRIDMPATKNGVNVYAERSQPLNYSDYAKHLKRHGVGVPAGESVMVTKIKVKDKHIEFQLDGGGYGTIGDETVPSVYVPLTGKSRREKRLDDELKDERDEGRRRELREEIDDLRRKREREDQRNQAATASAREIARDRIERRRSQGGSRFNIHFDGGMGYRELTPERIMAVLEEYVDFPDSGRSPSSQRKAGDEDIHPPQTKVQ